MKRRYQVFISSTFEDLQPARQEVSQALLQANCFPAGMELFPAADIEQFEYIKEIIDQSDYYLIISAGRYGSIDPNSGLSYTELEYDYAYSSGKPIIRLLHRDPFNLLHGRFIESSDFGRNKLEEFRAKLKKSTLVKFWTDYPELGKNALLGLLDAQSRHPMNGWVRSSEPLGAPIMAEKGGSVDVSAAVLKVVQEIMISAKGEVKLDTQTSPSDYSEQVFGAISNLISGLTHDLQSLTSATAFHCHQLLVRKKRGSADHSNLVAILQNTNRTQSLTEMLRAYAQRQVLNFETTDICVFVTNLLHLLSRLCGPYCNIEFHVEHSKAILARVDKRQFEQVIMNLVVNAREAMRDRGTIKISVHRENFPDKTLIDGFLFEAGSFAVVSVKDGGVGMSSDVLSNIFKPFYTTKDKGQGTGLGLASSQGIVNQFGGKILVRSAVGIGSEFRVMIPIAEV